MWSNDSKNRYHLIGFKIIEISDMIIGVGIKDVVESKDYGKCSNLGG